MYKCKKLMKCNICFIEFINLKKFKKCNFKFCKNCLYKYAIKYKKKNCPQCKDINIVNSYIKEYKIKEIKLNYIKKFTFIILFPILYMLFLYLIGNFIIFKLYKFKASIILSLLSGFFIQILVICFIFTSGLIFPFYLNFLLNKLTL